MSKPVIKHQIRIQSETEYWFTVEDFYLDADLDLEFDGFTISYWENNYGEEIRVNSIPIDETEALAVADAIYKLFKKEDN